MMLNCSSDSRVALFLAALELRELVDLTGSLLPTREAHNLAHWSREWHI